MRRRPAAAAFFLGDLRRLGDAFLTAAFFGLFRDDAFFLGLFFAAAFFPGLFLDDALRPPFLAAMRFFMGLFLATPPDRRGLLVATAWAAASANCFAMAFVATIGPLFPFFPAADLRTAAFLGLAPLFLPFGVIRLGDLRLGEALRLGLFFFGEATVTTGTAIGVIIIGASTLRLGDLLAAAFRLGDFFAALLRLGDFLPAALRLGDFLAALLRFGLFERLRLGLAFATTDAAGAAGSSPMENRPAAPFFNTPSPTAANSSL